MLHFLYYFRINKFIQVFREIRQIIKRMEWLMSVYKYPFPTTNLRLRSHICVLSAVKYEMCYNFIMFN